MKKILLVDDSETLCQTIKAAVESNGDFEVRTETDSNLALAAIRQYHPDLIILDVLMPKVDGVTVAISLKNDPALNEIPVMFLTSLAEGETLIFGNIVGGYHVAPKGISTGKLIEAINKMLQE